MKPRRSATTNTPQPRIVETMTRVLCESRAATAVEYGLMLAFVVIVMIAGLTDLAGTTSRMWTRIEAAVAAAR